MSEQQKKNILDLLDAMQEALHYIEQESEYFVIRKGNVEVRMDCTKEEGGENGKA